MEVRDKDVVEELTRRCGESMRFGVMSGVGGRVEFGVQEVEGESVEVQEMFRGEESLDKGCTGVIGHLCMRAAMSKPCVL
jgi:hypothetical protein